MVAELKYRAYEPDQNVNKLKFVQKGKLHAYIPESYSMEPHITLDIGNMQIMVDLDDFKELARSILKEPTYKNNVVELKRVK